MRGLCIGGPYDGTYIELEYDTSQMTVLVPIPRPALLDFFSDDPGVAYQAVPTYTYYCEYLRLSDREIVLWRGEDLTLDGMWAAILDGYAASRTA